MLKGSKFLNLFIAASFSVTILLPPSISTSASTGTIVNQVPLSATARPTSSFVSLTSEKSSLMANDTTVITAKATGKSPEYRFWICDEGNWYIVQDFSPKNTYKFKPTKQGKFKFWIDVREDKNTDVARDDYKEVEVNVTRASAVFNSLTASKPSVGVNDTSVITAKATGKSPEYRFWILDNGNWYIVQDFSPNGTYNFKPTKEGKFKFWIDVREDKNTDLARDAYKEVEVNVTRASAVFNSLTASKPSVGVGDTSVITAKATGNSPEYRFWICDEGNWYIVQDFSPNGTYNFKPTKQGKFKFWIDVREDKNTDLARDAYKEVEVNATRASAVFDSLTASKPSVGVNDTSVITAKATGKSPEYRFWILDNGNWSIVQDFSPKSTYDFKPTKQGKFKFWIDVREDKNTDLARDAYKEVEVNVTRASAVFNSLTASKPSVGVNDTSVITAKATGKNPEYRFWICDEGNWYIVQDFSPNGTYNFKPTKKGNFKFWVDVREDKNTDLARDDYKEVSVTVLPRSTSTFLSLTPSKSSMEVNETVAITAKSTGKSPEYRFWICENDEWYIVQDFSPNGVYNFKPTKEGNFKFWVDVREDKNTDVARDDYKEVQIQVGNNAFFFKEIKTSLPSPQKVGTKVNVKPVAQGVNLEYKFSLYDGNSWTVLRDFSKIDNIDINLSKYATYRIRVDVKPFGGNSTSKEISFSTILNVAEPNVIENSFSWNGEFENREATKYLVYHHTESSKDSAENIHAYHQSKGWVGIGYHFFVKKDGTIYRGRPENVIGAHAIGFNHESIGIAAEGRYEIEYMPIAQRLALIRLGEYLKEKYDIKGIYGHGEVSSTDCPGKNYPLLEIKNAVMK
ncbi:N-acetylmuramoyl-L-alanine amidase [Clostridium hydrogeniformans]|uniref:N-acetylmuramoyl-L-alanine amidase n=1 Tax=Clostridium hydrogeniformans TaxID=349933 RepID=UPI0006895E67|nr:N-acetylmuramoyl-L-alanine amidase [Clostridium hydrogeniformans]